MKRYSDFGLILTAVALAVLAASCGQFFPSASTITSITISPASAQILPGGTQQYSATGTFGNNTTGDVTSQVTWKSSATNVATIDTSGLATAVALGTTNITATSGSVISTVSPLTVSNKTVQSVSVTCTLTTLTAGSQTQCTATANYSDGTNGQVTASWTSSDQTVATVGSTSGLVTAVATGSATISAVYGGQTGTIGITVQ